MELLRNLGAVAAVLLLLGMLVRWLRKNGSALPLTARHGGARRRRLEICERLALTPQHSLHLVRLADHGLLIAVSPAGCSVLRQSDWKELQSEGATAE